MELRGRQMTARDSASAQSPGMLAGVTVIDLGQIYNAPYATLLMAEAGARVIKVEPRGGERNRKRIQNQVNGAGYPFQMMNSNKLGVTLNLKSERGRSLLRQMAARADVLVENFRPGVMEKLGLGADVLLRQSPKLIYASSSGFGRDSAYGNRAAMDVTIQAMSGAMEATGYEHDPPVKSGAAIADFLGGVHLFGGIVTALVRRERRGIGGVVDVAMLDVMIPAMVPAISSALVWHHTVVRSGNHDVTRAHVPYGMYPTADGYVVITVRLDSEWRSLSECLVGAGFEVPQSFDDVTNRIEQAAAVDSFVERWTRTNPTAEILYLARSHGLPCAPVRDLADVLADPYLRDRGVIVDVEVAGTGRLPVLRSPITVEGEKRLPLRTTPMLGEHNREIYVGWLGIPDEEFLGLADAGVV